MDSPIGLDAGAAIIGEGFFTTLLAGFDARGLDFFAIAIFGVYSRLRAYCAS